jgi:hypothetical protein
MTVEVQTPFKLMDDALQVLHFVTSELLTTKQLATVVSQLAFPSLRTKLALQVKQANFPEFVTDV